MDKSNDYADELKDKLDTLLGTINKDKIWTEGESSRKIKGSMMSKNDGETLRG
jgi:hypothetical protein